MERSKEFGSFYAEASGGEGDRCNYPTRLDTYGCGCAHDCNYCYDSKPAYTAIASVRNIRVVDKMFLSDTDLVNISSFPQDYDFTGSSVQFITGMSVPPSMMANIAHEIREQWLEN